MAGRPTIAIVGCGRAGGSIGLALKRAGYPVTAAWSNTRQGRSRAAALLDVPVLATPAEVAHTARLTFVAVPDDAIADVAKDLATGVRTGARIVHTSGIVSVEALAPVREHGGRIGGVHPLQTLPDARTGADALDGAAVAVTCEDSDRRYLYRVASAWGGRPFPLPDGARDLYHAAAVFASNYVTTTLWIATRLLEQSDIRAPLDVLGPLVRTTVDNAITMGPERAITGPVARGDLGAVARHAGALARTAPDALEAYRCLARQTARLVHADLQALEDALG